MIKILRLVELVYLVFLGTTREGIIFEILKRSKGNFHDITGGACSKINLYTSIIPTTAQNISPAYVTKSTGKCEFGHIYCRNP